MRDQVFWLIKLCLGASLHRVTLMFYWYVAELLLEEYVHWLGQPSFFVFQLYVQCIQGYEYTSLAAQCWNQSDEELTQTNTSVSERFCKVKY